MIKNLIPNEEDIKCKVYLLHGDMTEDEMHSLYQHSKIKAMISLSHGEGFGLPLFEAAYSGLPVIAPDFSGQVDFLNAPVQSTSKKKKNKKILKQMFANVEYTIGDVPESAVWDGVIEKGTKWAYPTEGSYKLRLRQVRNNYDKWLKKALYLKEWILEEFEWDKKHDLMASHILEGQASVTDEEIESLFESLLEENE
jgi:glycosyltransferase involved in cell wall biosynthesis